MTSESGFKNPKHSVKGLRSESEDPVYSSLEKMECSLSLDLICIVDINNMTVLRVNPSLSALLGYPEKYLLDKSFFDFIHPEDVPSSKKYLESKRISEKKVIKFTNRYRCMDGSYRWVTWSSRPVPEQGIIHCTALEITDRGLSNEEAWKRESFARMVIDHLPIGIAVHATDPPFLPEYVNDNYLKYYRMVRGKVTNPDDFWETVYEDPKFREEIKRRATEDVASGDPSRMIWRDVPITRKGEETTYVTAQTIPVYEKNLLIATVWDVTDRKKTEDKLKETQRLYEEIQSIAKLGGWEYDIALHRLLVTDEMYRIYGLEPGSISPLNLIDTNFQQAINSRESFDFEYKITRKDDAKLWVRSLGYPVIEDGQAVKMIGYIMDITSQKQAEEMLKKYERIVSTSQDFLLMINTEYVFEAINESFLRAMNKTREEVLGAAAADVMGEEIFVDILKPQLDKAFTGKIVREHFHFDSSETGRRLMQDTIFPMMNANGTIDGAVLNVRDITETQKLEEQLAQSQKLESIGRLAGGIAHDLNNLLTPILSYGEMLLEDYSPDDPRKHKADQIVQAGFRARDLVRQLLAFSRKQALEYKPVNVNRVVSNFEKLLRRTIRENIGIKITLAENIQTIKADEGQIEQVIMNLAVNAADAMLKGGDLSIETSMAELDKDYADTHQGVQPGRYVMIAVSDKGCGIDKEVQKYIFEPFFSTKGELGTGLGLSTVYGIVKQHKGNIWVYSEPGHGTTFKVYLPVGKGTTDDDNFEEDIVTDVKGDETILIAEDNEMVREIGHAILTNQGYTVLVAENGSKALEILASHADQVHLLLTDLIMPGMNGRELYEKATEKYPDLKVLYMSGYTDDVIVHQGILDEGVQLIEKPFTVGKLITKVREVLMM